MKKREAGKRKSRKFVLGYIYSEKRPKEDEKIFMKIAKKKGIELVMFNIIGKINEKDFEEKAKRCDVIFNNSAEEFAEEIVKTFEELGKKVVDSSKNSYYPEDKWIFYLECRKNKIPVPETILLSENVSAAKKELEEFDRWPAILKRVTGTQGQYVELAKNAEEAERIIKRFWKKGSEKLPIIAQEFINSPSYRVTLIGNDIVQTAIKDGKRWKKTGVYEKKITKFKPDEDVTRISKKLARLTKIKVCGIDLLKKNGKWVVLEINAEPAFDFFASQREVLIEDVIEYLVKNY
jgi:ribosomal protein S6--L-glutamate ligase